MPHVNNVIFPESKFALLFRHTTENKFGKQKQHSVLAICTELADMAVMLSSTPNSIRMSSSLSPDQAQQNFEPDLDPIFFIKVISR